MSRAEARWMASRVQSSGGASRRANAITSPLMGFSRIPDSAVSAKTPSSTGPLDPG